MRRIIPSFLAALLLASTAAQAYVSETTVLSTKVRISGPTGSYGAIIPTTRGLAYFGNENSTRVNQSAQAWYSDLWRYSCASWTSCSTPPTKAFDRQKITDLSSSYKMVTRNATAADPSHSGTVYSFVHVSNGYSGDPGFDGIVFPAVLKSTDGGLNFSYLGKIRGSWIKPALHYWGSSMAWIVNTDRPLDTAHPLNNKFVAYLDGYDADLALIYSADGVNWSMYKDATGKTINVYPAELAASDAPVFPSMVKTPVGYEMAVADKWYPAHQRHLRSCDGIHWEVMGSPSSTGVFWGNGKNATLSYDPAANLIHANMRYASGSTWVGYETHYKPASHGCGTLY